MLGYIVPCKSELKIREFEVYNAYYCAVCHSIRDRYGQLPRLLLSYDSVFLAMMISALDSSNDEIKTFHCLTHPFKKRNIVSSMPEIDYAADILVILAYFNLKDDKEDERKAIGYAGELLLRSAYKKIKARMPDKAATICDSLDEIKRLEKADETQIDVIEEPFAVIMETVMDWPGIDDLEINVEVNDKKAFLISMHLAYRQIGHYLGKWIYLIDAIDDLEMDIKSGSYNPLKYEEYTKERLHLNLQLYLAKVAEAMELLPLRKNIEILKNIVYVGLNIKTDEILEKFSKEKMNAESI